MSSIETPVAAVMASVRLGRTILLAIAIEVVSILGLIAVVAMAGPHEKSAAMAFAERTGRWFGPLAGAVLCLAGGYEVGKRAMARPVLNGAVLGAAVALIDAALLVLGEADFRWRFAASNQLRVAAGTVGGALAARAR